MAVLAEKRNRPLPNPVPQFIRKVDTGRVFAFTAHLWNRGDMVPVYDDEPVEMEPVEEIPEVVKVAEAEGPTFETRVQEVKDAMVKVPTEIWTSFGPPYAELEKILKRKVPKAEYSVAIRELKKEAPDEIKTSDS